MQDWSKSPGTETYVKLEKRSYKLKGLEHPIDTSLRVDFSKRTLKFDRMISLETNGGHYLTDQIPYDFETGLRFPKIRQDLIHKFKTLEGIVIVSADNHDLAGHWKLTKPLKVCGVTWPADTQFSDFGSRRKFKVRPMESFSDGKQKFVGRKVYIMSGPLPGETADCVLHGPGDPDSGEYTWDSAFGT